MLKVRDGRGPRGVLLLWKDANSRVENWLWRGPRGWPLGTEINTQLIAGRKKETKTTKQNRDLSSTATRNRILITI